MALTPTQIRTGIVSRLAAANTLAGPRVFDSKGSPYPDSQLYPVINVWTAQRTGRRTSVSRPSFERTDEVHVVGTVGTLAGTAEATVAANIDTLEGQILAALFGDSGWDNQFARVDFAIDAGPVDSEGQRLRLAGVEVTLTCVQRNVLYDHAPAPVDEFEIVRVRTDFVEGGTAPDGKDDHVAQINLPGAVP